VNFFYYAVFIAAGLLAWRFHSTRVLFSVIVLLMGHHALEFFSEGRGTVTIPGRIAFEAVALLLPLNFILLTFFPERSAERRILSWFLALLFFESVFVAVISRPDQLVPGFLHFSLISPYHPRLPQPAMLVFIAAIVFLLFRLLQFHKAIESGMLWSLIAAWMGLQAGGAGKIGSAYFGVAALVLASSIVENSYSLAYHDELTGLSSRRAFNDALLRLKAPYAIAAVDIDHFKSINDNYGHDTGDQVLRLVASQIARVGGGGKSFRVGGEEFTILFPNRTAKEVTDYLELLRLNIENFAFRVRSGQERRKTRRDKDRRTKSDRRTTRETNSGMLSVTVSIGLAECQPKFNVEEVIQQADKALYRAKQGGRNRLETAEASRKRLSTRKYKTKKAELS
jgi:diguanylate cyclase (GGDEF)-like protein